MAKIFPVSLEGSYATVVRHLSHLDIRQQAAIDRAFQGDYHLSVALFRRCFQEIPRVPRGWRPHEDVLAEMRHAMEDSLSRFVQRMVLSLRKNLHGTLKSATESEAEGRIDELLQNHARDIEHIVETSMKLTHMGLFTDHMRTHGITDARLKQLEVMFTEAPPSLK